MLTRSDRLLFAIALLVAVLIGGYSMTLYLAAVSADLAADGKKQQLLASFIETYASNAVESLSHIAVSDEAFDAAGSTGDVAYFAQICASPRIAGEFSSFGVLDIERGPLFLCEYGAIKTPAEHGYVFETAAPRVRALWARVGPDQARFGKAIAEFSFRRDFVRIDDRPYLLIAAVIAPRHTRDIVGRAPHSSLFALINLDKTVLRDANEALDLSGLSFHPAGYVNPNAHSFDLAAADGRPVISIAWKRSGEFRHQLMNMLPSVLAISLILFVLMVRYLKQVSNLQKVIVAKELEARHAAMHDGMTGLPNRMHFTALMHTALLTASPHKPLFVGLLDLDHFKSVNDNHGHDAGDALIIEASRRIAAVIGGGKRVARLGGDEFAFLIDDCVDAEAARRRCDSLDKAIRQPLEFAGITIRPSASIGIAEAPRDGSEGRTILKAADIALYAAKRGGRGQFCFYDAKLASAA
jgi:diguanylate cyclase (GGDEF)-like protein